MDGDAPIYGSDEAATDSLCEELLQVSHHWIHLGVLLGVQFFQLKSMKGTNQQNLRDTINLWLNSLGDVTLQRLVEAVEHKAGGNNPRLAEVLRKKYG